MAPIAPGVIGTGSWAEAVAKAGPGWLVLRASWAEIEAVRGEYDSAVVERGRAALLAARKRGIEPVISVHSGALPDWQLAREGWLDPDVGAAWGCYVDRLAHAYGELVRFWIAFEEPLYEAAWYDEQRGMVARGLLDAIAVAYLHLKRAPGTAGRPPWVGVVERFASWREGRLRGRVDAALRGRLGPESLVRVLATGRLSPPFGAVGELPNGTHALDWVGLRWEGVRRVTDGERTGEVDEEALDATLERIWLHARPVALFDAPPGAAERAWARGVRVMADVR